MRRLSLAAVLALVFALATAGPAFAHFPPDAAGPNASCVSGSDDLADIGPDASSGPTCGRP